MPSSYRILRVFGISVELHITFIIFLFIFFLWGWQEDGFMGGVALVSFFALIFMIVLIHELTHSIAALLNGIKVPRIILTPIGGLAHIEIPEKPVLELVISIVGPLSNFLMAGVFMVLFMLVIPDPVGKLLEYKEVINNGSFSIKEMVFSLPGVILLLVEYNLILGIFNFIPAFPMDGGRVLRAILALFIDYTKATKIAVNIGQFISVVMAIAGILLPHIWLTVIGIIIFFAGGQELKIVRIRHALGGLRAGDVAAREIECMDNSITVGDFLERIAKPSQRHYPVCDVGGKIVGILDISRLGDMEPRDFNRVLVGDISDRQLEHIDSKALLSDMLMKLLEKDFILVVESSHVIGYLTPNMLLDAARFQSMKKLRDVH